MNMGECKCDILHVLENDNHTILQKWISSCREFRSQIIAKIEDGFVSEKNCAQKKSINSEKILELEQKIDTVKSSIDAITLQKMVIDKKILNVIKSQDTLKEILDDTKGQRDNLSLELVDLQLETESKKNHKVLQWDAIKRACNVYKVNLDMHINLQEEKDCQCVKISLFTYSETTKDKYFVQLSRSDDRWSVEQIEPKLEKEHLNELSLTTDQSGKSRISDISLFLCQRLVK